MMLQQICLLNHQPLKKKNQLQKIVVLFVGQEDKFFSEVCLPEQQPFSPLGGLIVYKKALLCSKYVSIIRKNSLWLALLAVKFFYNKILPVKFRKKIHLKKERKLYLQFVILKMDNNQQNQILLFFAKFLHSLQLIKSSCFISNHRNCFCHFVNAFLSYCKITLTF